MGMIERMRWKKKIVHCSRLRCAQLHTLFYCEEKLHFPKKLIKFYLHAHVDLQNLITEFIPWANFFFRSFFSHDDIDRSMNQKKNCIRIQMNWKTIKKKLTSSCSRWNFSFFLRASWTLSWINENKKIHKIK